MKKFPSSLLVAVSALIMASPAANAQVFVKPTGSKAIPLRVQSLRAEVEIIGAFAVTKWTMQIQTENLGLGNWYNRGGVCDFVCARPRDAKVTSFDMGKELPGRVEERAAIAPHVAFRAAPNDPLLRSQLNAGNSLRATVYPFSSWNGIVVNCTWVQPLTSSATGLTYRLPLLALRGATTRLSELNTKITFRDGALPAVSNNYNLPLRTQNGARVFTLGQKNYRVVRDLILTIKPPQTPSSIPTLVYPGNKTGPGNFAFAFVAPRALNNLTVSGTGIENTLFSPSYPRAGQLVQVSGRYRGGFNAFDAKISAEGLSPVPLTPVENEVASAIWATQKINALSADAVANRAQIIALSKRYSVLSSFTSWLAINEDNRKIYRRALVSSQLDPLVREYWMHVGDGQDGGARVAQLKRAINQICVANGANVEDELYMRLGEAYQYVLSQKYSDYLNEKKKFNQTLVKNRIDRLSAKMLAYVNSQTGKQPTRSVDWASPLYAGELLELRTKIMTEYRAPHPDYVQLKEWERRFAQLYGSTNYDPRTNFWRAEVKARELEAQTTAAEQANDTARLTELKNARIANSRNAYFTNNIGDPPIYVRAPADARQVIAIMPDGKIKTLDYNRSQKRWEGNYDVPVGTRDGDYKIQILIVNANGSRHRYAMPFRVDTKAPSGKGAVELASSAEEQLLRLEVEHSGDVAVVSALLPWSEKVALLPSTMRATTFFGSAHVPDQYRGKPIKVTYILVDRAHNVTSIEAESVSVPSSP